MTTFITILILLGLAYWWLSSLYQSVNNETFDFPEPPLMVEAGHISDAHNDVVTKLRTFHSTSGKSISARREHMENFLGKEITDVEFLPVDVKGMAAEWVLAENSNPNHRLLYLHGGAFTVGSPKSHRYITSEISKKAGVAVLAIDYRMQPEFKTIHCHQDARTAYRWILENGPDANNASQPEKLFVAGDSAGGNLTLAVIAWARDTGLRAADGAIAMAPLTDATMSSTSWTSNLATDPFLSPGLKPLAKVPKSLLGIMMRFSTGTGVNNPEVSPLLGNLNNLPDTLLQASSAEMLYGDSVRYYNKCKSHQGQIELQVWPKLVHVFQGFGPELPEAVEALNNIADFIKQRTSVERVSKTTQG